MEKEKNWSNNQNKLKNKPLFSVSLSDKKKKKTVEECGQGNIKFVDCFISFVPRSTSEAWMELFCNRY